MTNNLNQAQRRAMQYWFIDGLGEIFSGLVFFLLAIFFTTQQFEALARWAYWIFFVLAFAGTYGLRAWMKHIKARSTHPRTGYAAPLSGWENKRASAILIGFAVLLLLFNLYLAVWRPGLIMWSPLLAGVIIAFILGWTGYQASLTRFYYVAGFALLAGMVLSLTAPGDMFGAAILSGLVGLILLVSGIRTRRAYLRENPMPSTERDEH